MKIKYHWQKLSPALRRYGWLVILGGFLIGLTWRPLRVLLIQRRAGQKIETYIHAHASQYKHYFTCQIPVLTTLPADADLEHAVTLLETAQDIRPQDAHTHLLLGQAYCLLGDYPNAIDSFGAFNQARPGNPLGELETVYARLIWKVRDKNLNDAERLALETEIRLALEGMGRTGEVFLNQADEAYLRREYQTAWMHYQVANTFQSLTGEPGFRAALLNLVYNQANDILENLDEVFFQIIDDDKVISPQAFFRLESGEGVTLRTELDWVAAVYLTNQDPGATIFEVNYAGQYCLSIKALDRPPEPTLIEVTLDLEPLMMIELTEGDDLWHLTETELFLEEGWYTLGFRLTNDLFKPEQGIDRNGYVGEILIENCKSE